MRRNSFASLDEILKQKEFEKINAAIEENEVVEKFAEIFHDLKKIAKAKKINNKTLFLRVENAVWRSELNLNKNAIIKKINERFGKEIVKTIRFI